MKDTSRQKDTDDSNLQVYKASNRNLPSLPWIATVTLTDLRLRALGALASRWSPVSS